jgi:hypothetical protein
MATGQKCCLLAGKMPNLATEAADRARIEFVSSVDYLLWKERGETGRHVVLYKRARQLLLSYRIPTLFHQRSESCSAGTAFTKFFIRILLSVSTTCYLVLRRIFLMSRKIGEKLFSYQEYSAKSMGKQVKS